MQKNPEEIIHDLLSVRALTLCAAESCTGGLVSDRITNIPGSSAYFPGGIVTYSNEMKASLLGVPWTILNKHGAVSAETVRAMAQGARKIFSADIAVSVSGIAGPGGGSAEKPVGTTWLGLSAKDGEWARHFLWNGDREKNKQNSAAAALQFVIDYLEGKLR